MLPFHIKMSSFAEINLITDFKATTFTYNLEDSENILFPRAETNVLQSETIQNSMKHYKYLLEKEIRYNLHGSTLSEYWRASRIPRGLRIQKAPTIGGGDPEFCKKWCEIMNKASLDLTLLVVEFTQKELKKVREEIEETKASITASHGEVNFNQQLELFNTSLGEFKKDIQQKKIRKFRRDTLDYKENRVYPWLNRNSTFSRSSRKVRFEDETRHTSASSGDSEVDFLDNASEPEHHPRMARQYPLRRRPPPPVGGDVGRRGDTLQPTLKRGTRQKTS